MPAAQQSTSSTFEGFEEKRYTLRIVSGKETTSPPPDSNPQHEFAVAIEGYEDPERGGEVTRRMWTSQKWSEAEGKVSHQTLLARALLGPGVTLDQWEQLDYPDMAGMRFSALVALNAAGWPTINKDSIKAPLGSNPAHKNQAALPQTNGTMRIVDAPVDLAAPRPAAQAQLPNKPTRPSFKPQSELRTDEQVEELMGRAAVNNPPLSATDVEAWVTESYPDKTLATITRGEAEQLINALLPF